MMPTAASKPNLFDLDRAGLARFFTDIGEKPYRATQLMGWVYHEGVRDFEAMTNLGKGLRAKLAEHAELQLPEMQVEQRSKDGTRKWLLKMAGGNAVETVFIPEAKRGTLCISSQVGCTLDCTFCSTAQQGFNRNLTAGEIVAQVWYARHMLAKEAAETGRERIITNVVFMGMGEPLSNFDQATTAVSILLDDFGFGLSKRRVTISTSGIVPRIDELRETTDVALAVSLHAPNDALRDQLVPLNKKYPIAELLDACRRYLADKSQRTTITWEYVMLDGVNDSDANARELAKILTDIPSKINLIPFNPFPGTAFKRSPNARIQRFADILVARGCMVTTRRTRGDDIDAACGQLVGRVDDRSRRAQRMEKHREEATIMPLKKMRVNRAQATPHA